MNSRQLVLRILNRFDQRPSNLERLVDHALKDGYVDHRDRRLIFEIVYGIVRRMATLDYIIDTYLSDERYRKDRLLRRVLWIGVYQLMYLDRVPDHAAVNETVNLAKSGEQSRKFAGTVNAVLRAIIKNKKQFVLPDVKEGLSKRLSVEYSHPLWLIDRWLKQIGLARTKKLIVFNNGKPSIFLRRSLRLLTRQQFEADVRFICDAATGYRELYYRLKKNLLPENLQLIYQGWCNVQAPSSGWVVALMEIGRGEHLLDMCAAPGGKSVLMAELAGDSGTVCACEVNYKRFEKLRETADRMQVSNIYCLAADGKHPPINGTFDKVLLDAPCTATGVLHRHPEARWMRTEEDVHRLAGVQAQLLDAATSLVETGGILVYATCSLEPEENQLQMESFLLRHPDFILDSCPNTIPARFIDGNGYLRITPYEHDMDGMFAARMKKVG